LIEENHSFDSIFAEYPNADGKFGPRVCPENVTDYLADMMSPNTPYVCSYHEEQVPNYWKMARNFALCDNYFSEVKAPSCPNFMMLGTAQSTILENPTTPWRCPDFCVDIPSFADILDERGLTWRDYGGNNAVVKSLQGRSEITFNSLTDFFDDAWAGNLQNVIWINTFLLGGNKTSGHPPGNICDAENYAVDIINAVMKSPQWDSTLIFVIWDEWGGFYDHVIPPPVEAWPDGRDFRYGGRAPCIIISPYAKKGYVSHTLASHVSILKTIEDIFGLRSLNDRDGKANNLLDCLDFNQNSIAPLDIWKRTCSS
jgi:phospholipase C